MRKFNLVIVSLLALIILSTPAFAGKRVTSKKLLISGAPITDYAIGSGATVTTDSLYQSGNVGFTSLLTKVSGSVTISYQVSNDNSNWYTPYTTDGSSLTAAGAIASAITTDRWVILTAKLAPYVRFIYASSGSSTISSTAIWQDEN